MSRAARVLASLTTALTLASTVPAQAAEPFEETLDLSFPTVATARFTHDYHQDRSGGARKHKATDVMAPKHAPAYAVVDGTICYINGIDEPMPSWGYSLSICGDDGRRYAYLHLNNDTPGTDDGLGGPEHAYAPGIRRGVRVARGQLVGYVGDSGNAEDSGAHIHFEIHDERVVDPYGDTRMDPYPSLVAAVARGDFPDGSVAAPEQPAPSTDEAPRTRRTPTPRAAGVARDRVSGPDRVATAIALSRSAFTAAGTVVVAPSTSPSEAIVSGPLAAALDGPVLTTHPDALDPRVLDELIRLGATDVVTVGLPRHVADALGSAGYVVERITGADRFATAAAVAERTWELLDQPARTAAHVVAAPDPTVPGVRRAILALGSHPDEARAWPDSLMASYYGAATGQPVLLVAHDGIPPVTLAALAGVSEVTIIGGTAAVSADLAAQVAALGATVERLWGPTRYSTALAVSDALVDSGIVAPRRTWAATGRNWPDAATSGPVVARSGDLLVLVDGDGTGADAETRDYVRSRPGAVEEVVAVGGAKAVADGALSALSSWAT